MTPSPVPDITPLARMFKEFGETLNVWVQERLPQLLGLMQKVNEAAWTGYRDAGMPYGETHEGLLQWMEDMRVAKQHLDAVEAILRHHRDLRLSRLAEGVPTQPIPVVDATPTRKKQVSS